MDPTSSGRGVRQFKTYLLHRLQKEEEETRPVLAKNDPREIQKYYQIFYEKNIREGQYTKKPEEMAKIYQIATVLYDVLRTVVPQSKVDPETQRYAKDVEEKKEQYTHYNILPLYAVGVKPAIMELPEIKAALQAIRNVDNLPKFQMPEGNERTVNDILEWLALCFGFQKGNVANQREHLILLLANMDVRRNTNLQNYELLEGNTVETLMDKIFKNYQSWCKYLHVSPHLGCPLPERREQSQLLYIGLYLLIWGEASNIRFMPECLCYIFHCMANEMHGTLFGNVEHVTGSTYQTVPQSEESFLKDVVTPIYEVMRKEVRRNKNGKASHSAWRNYDDLNEYFWTKKCLKLGWPLDTKADFFVHSDVIKPASKRLQGDSQPLGKRKPKTNFVELRTFWHLYRSFDRMWIFFTLALQAMIIIAWHQRSSSNVLFDEDVVRSILSIFITAAILNFLRAVLDIVLSFNAWRTLKYTQILRYLLKLIVAAFWLVAMPVTYSRSYQNPTGILRFFNSLGADWQTQSLYNYCVAIYLIPNILAAILFLFPFLRRTMERSNWRIIIILMWWAQPKLYVGRGMHEDMFSLLKYTLFWITLIISKLAFSYYVEILPLIDPTRTIMDLSVTSYDWHEFFPHATNNIPVVIAIWAPIILVYFMDTQIWYAIFSTFIGGIYGAFSHLGEIRTLGMLRARFESVPSAFSKRLVPYSREEMKQREQADTWERINIAKFSQMWNEFILSMRNEDLINHRERDLLLVPYSSSDVSVVQWPPFLLASKIPIALDMAKDFKEREDGDLLRKIKNDDFMYFAIIECYETLRDVLLGLLVDEGEKDIIRQICDEVESSIQRRRFLREFKMSGLPLLSDKLDKFLELLMDDYEDAEVYRSQMINTVQDIVEIIIEDVMTNGHEVLEKAHAFHHDQREQKFEKVKIDLLQSTSWREKVVRLHLLLTVKESAINVPMNLEARRRITFFANSLFMIMPTAPKVRNMLSFSILTPYYKEPVLYSTEELKLENEDGISTLFYLQKIYPDEWKNYLERIGDPKLGFANKDRAELDRHWVSYRGQTLARTVRGMMYYRETLELQCYLDFADDNAIFGGYRAIDINHRDYRILKERAQALADLKFTYVVSCQVYGAQKKSSSNQERSCYVNILNLMLKYPSLRVAYIDERDEPVNGNNEKVYYSVLVKGGEKLDEEIYRIKLPGPPTEIGEGKPENQNHAIIFTRGEALQTIDMNQDNYFEEAFKMRNVLEEFLKTHPGQRRPTILGLREHIFTGSVSSLAWFMSNQETSFVTIGQRILANPLRVRFHYGHPDIFDRLFHLTRGGISKASRTINLSEDVFAGYNSTLRRGYVTHHEYIQVGKGRDVGMNQISLFEAKVANGNGEQTLSRDVYRLGRRFDFYRMLSFYFTTVGFYFSSMVTVLTTYVFLYGRLYMVLSGLERRILEDPSIRMSKALEEAMATQSFFQLGVLLVLPMVMEIGLERGFRNAIGDFVVMQLQLASVFFTFQLGTKAHYFGRTILHGGSKYRATGRGFVVFHAKFAENYRMYSRSHFVKGLELFILLIVYEVYGHSYRSSSLYFFVTFSMWFLVASWLFAPFVFNPSGFEWQKTVDDWTDWKRWMGNRGGIGISPDKSWESWWNEEQEHLKYTNIRGRILEIILALRFFIYQYGVVYHLRIAHGSKNILVYGLSWFVMATVLLVLKMVSMGRRKFGTDFQLMFRILKALLFLGFISVMTVLFVVCGLAVSDLFAAILAFMPTGWALILIAQACRPCLKGIGIWDSVMELSRAYEAIMGLIIFTPIVVLSWFPFVSEFQTRLLFNQAFSRGLQISMILAGRKDKNSSD
ncbi:1,3-beta-glucan synthase/callose synthase catalytic subunit [Handroanthus impetiginosus]|uniref:1,3-beta-glucan synthase n=1 Tax=Handroanthus impetiginosus TaxID=429701 RepID=A0A2G9I779_9LAMI|nr:1,3-beta-glucan synthase/callose synthase catalytic subunit [Handroanthus impetiginosus]